ncbi:MAG TPA: GntR family transcriptional regulator [Haliangiales bacterium]|nr:GntR family transcriptional regulator [Haliangiales bacterium]
MPLPHPSASLATPSLANVFDRLLADIVTGTYPPGARLPAERDLSRLLGASRPTLREALRRLGEWGMVRPRRGSGVEVRPIFEWSVDVLPTYLQKGAPLETLGPLVRDVLVLRKVVLLEVIRLVAPRLDRNKLAPARAAVERAWAARHDIARFVAEDFECIRAIARAADALPAVWMLNTISGVYLEIAKTMTGAAMVPDDYLDTYRYVLAALDSGNGIAAADALGRYFDHYDRRLMSAFAEVAP